MEACEQQGPRVAGGAAVDRFIGGWSRVGGAAAASAGAGIARAVTAARSGEFGASTP